LHRPDFLMNPHEIAEAFTQLKAAGKVINFGVSNFSPSQFELLNSFTPLSVHQVEISALHLAPFQNGILDQCLQHQVLPTAWSPFGGGAIFGEAATPVQIRLKAAAAVLAKQYDTSVDQILLAFLRSHPAGIIPILGTSKIERIKAACVQQNLQLTKEEWYALWQASTGEEIA
ncbi:MAG: aldo/keto reductase, partial [Saprospiraceae bacterium]